MITKSQLSNAIKHYELGSKMIDDLYKLNIDLIETDLFSSLGYLFDDFINSHFDESGRDTFNWWYFEGGREMWDENDNPIPMNTFDDLWNYLEKHLI